MSDETDDIQLAQQGDVSADASSVERDPVQELNEANQVLAQELMTLGRQIDAGMAANIKVDQLADLLLHGPFAHLYALQVANTFNNTLKAALEEAKKPKLHVPGEPDLSNLDLG